MNALKKSSVTLTAILFIFTQGCIQKYLDYGVMLDDRDGRSYTTIRIGDQTVLAENMHYEMQGSWCYDDAPENCKTYGRLYDWETAMQACPAGWHLPDDAEWSRLTDHLGGNETAGGTVKSTTLWTDPNTDATNASGFSGLPGGYRLENGRFDDLEFYGYWWSASEIGPYAWSRGLFFRYGKVDRNNLSKESALSVRCIKD